MKNCAKLIAIGVMLFSFNVQSFAGPQEDPNCPKGQIYKKDLKTGKMSCRADLAAKPTRNQEQKRGRSILNAQPGSTNAVPNPRPKCEKGKLAKFENGEWRCKNPKITSQPKDPDAAIAIPAFIKAR